MMAQQSLQKFLLRPEESSLKGRSDSKLALRLRRRNTLTEQQKNNSGVVNNDDGRNSTDCCANFSEEGSVTQEEIEYGQINARLERQIRSLDQLQRPVMSVLCEQPLSEKFVPEDIKHSRENSAHKVKRLPNRVQDIFKKIHSLKEELLTVRRDFALDERYCSWADAKPQEGDFLPIIRRENDGAENNIFLKLIPLLHPVKQEERPRERASVKAQSSDLTNQRGKGPKKDDHSNGACKSPTNKHQGTNLVVPLKRAELYDKAFDHTLQQVVTDLKDYTQAKAKLKQLKSKYYDANGNLHNAKNESPETNMVELRYDDGEGPFTRDHFIHKYTDEEKWDYAKYVSVPDSIYIAKSSKHRTSKKVQEWNPVSTRQQDFDELLQKFEI